MKMTTGDQQMAGPTQEGMDVAKMMKIMIYVSPLMMLFFNMVLPGLICIILYLIQLPLELC
jgi:membrane protein insertase Oxa1/YidC/SpoIIIJ